MTQTAATRTVERAAVDRACPSWCSRDFAANGSTHHHISEDVEVGTQGRALNARLVQLEDEPAEQIVVNGVVLSIEQATTFAAALRRLADRATLAPAGLGFLAGLTSRTGASDEQLAGAADVEPWRLAEQREGARVLTVHELDRLALAAAHLATGGRHVARVEVDPEVDPEVQGEHHRENGQRVEYGEEIAG